MAIDWRRVSRRIWFVNGVLLFVVMSGAALIAVAVVVPPLLVGRADAAVAIGGMAAGDEFVSARQRAVRRGLPQSIRGSTTQVVEVYHGAAQPLLSSSVGSGEYGRGRAEGPRVNVIFLEPDGGSRLLLDRPALITALHYPRPDLDFDSTQRFIAYELVLEDTDRNGRLTEDDARTLHVSDVTGNDLRPVLHPGLRLRRFAVSRDGRELHVLALDSTRARPGAAEAEWPERAFRFDPASGELRTFGALDTLADSAARILARSGR